MKLFINKLSRNVKIILLGSAAICALPEHAKAAGEADYSFNPPSFNEPIYAVAVDSRSNIWVGGAFTEVGGETRSSLVVLHPDGSVNTDYTFNFGTVVYGYVVGLATDSQGDVYAAYRGYNGGAGVARFNAPVVAGNPWQYDKFYSTNISAQINSVNSIALGSDRDLFVAGSIAGGYRLGRFNSAGGLENGYVFPALGNNAQIYQVTYRPAGAAMINGESYEWPDSLLLAGTFGVATGLTDGTVGLVYEPPAGEYFTCGAERNEWDQLTSPSPGPAGEILGGGKVEPGFINNGGFSYGPDLGMILERRGGLDSTNYFPPISKSANYPDDNGGFISRLVALPDGDLLAAGQFTSIHGRSVSSFAHLLPDGSVDADFPNYASVYAALDMARQADGKYLIAGIGQYSFSGALERRMAMPTNSVTFHSQPASQTIYEGESVNFTASVSAWPGVLAQWKKDGANLGGQTNTSLYLENVTTNDAGDYQLSVQTAGFSPAAGSSSNATLTVLPAPPAPANDLFVNAIPLEGSHATGTGTIRSATLEPGEPDAAGANAGRSVWWTWTATFSGQAYLDFSQCDFPAAVGIFTGDEVADQATVTNNYDASDGEEGSELPTSLLFDVSADVTYRIAIGGQPETGSPGHVVFHLGPSAASWSQPASATTSGLLSVAAGNHRLVAVGGDTIVTSADGVNWQADTTSAAGFYLEGAAFGGGKFILTGDDGVILTSADGANWTPQISGTATGLFAATFGNGIFVAVGGAGATLTSPDGINWTQQTNAVADWLWAVTYQNGEFIAGGDDGEIVTSPDGIHWTRQVSPVSDEIWGVTGGNGTLVAVGDDGDIITSPDGTNWTQQTSGVDSPIYGISYGNGHFVAVGDNGTLLLSTDATNWISDDPGVNNGLYAVSYFQNGSFAIVGDEGVILFNQPPRLGQLNLLPGHTLQFNLNGLSGSTAIIEATPTLAPPDWQPIATNVIDHGVVIFTEDTTSRSLYYRARVQ